MKITFSNIAVANAFGSMAEGMEECQSDDDGVQFARELGQVQAILWSHTTDGAKGPVTVEVPDALSEAVYSIRENLFCQEEDWSGEDDEALRYNLTESDIAIAQEVK